jgi:hypothetical protein
MVDGEQHSDKLYVESKCRAYRKECCGLKTY